MMEEDFWGKFYTTSEDNNRHGAYEILKILFDKTEGLFVEINGEDDPNQQGQTVEQKKSWFSKVFGGR
jgi:hypothetical protein